MRKLWLSGRPLTILEVRIRSTLTRSRTTRKTKISIGMMRMCLWHSLSLVPRYTMIGDGERGSFSIMTMRHIPAMKKPKNLDYKIFR